MILKARSGVTNETPFIRKPGASSTIFVVVKPQEAKNNRWCQANTDDAKGDGPSRIETQNQQGTACDPDHSGNNLSQSFILAAFAFDQAGLGFDLILRGLGAERACPVRKQGQNGPMNSMEREVQDRINRLAKQLKESEKLLRKTESDLLAMKTAVEELRRKEIKKRLGLKSDWPCKTQLREAEGGTNRRIAQYKVDLATCEKQIDLLLDNQTHADHVSSRPGVGYLLHFPFPPWLLGKSLVAPFRQRIAFIDINLQGLLGRAAMHDPGLGKEAVRKGRNFDRHFDGRTERLFLLGFALSFQLCNPVFVALIGRRDLSRYGVEALCDSHPGIHGQREDVPFHLVRD
jgi:hypothetical protein